MVAAICPCLSPFDVRFTFEEYQEWLIPVSRTMYQWHVTGRYGKKTKFQQNAIAQMVVLAEVRVCEEQTEELRRRVYWTTTYMAVTSHCYIILTSLALRLASRYRSVIQSLFQSQFSQKTTCGICGYKSRCYDVYSTVPLDVQGKDAINFLTESEGYVYR